MCGNLTGNKVKQNTGIVHEKKQLWYHQYGNVALDGYQFAWWINLDGHATSWYMR